MGQALEMCRGCQFTTMCYQCTDLHEWIMEHMEPRWISVKDMLPDDVDSYLVFREDGRYDIATYWGDGEWIIHDECSTCATDITYWMPIPELPEEVNDEY